MVTTLCLLLFGFVGCVNERTDDNFEDKSFPFVGYLEKIVFDSGSTQSGYLQLRGEVYESGIVTHIRVRFEASITRTEIPVSDLEIGDKGL